MSHHVDQNSAGIVTLNFGWNKAKIQGRVP